MHLLIVQSLALRLNRLISVRYLPLCEDFSQNWKWMCNTMVLFLLDYIYLYVCVCVCVCIYIYMSVSFLADKFFLRDQIFLSYCVDEREVTESVFSLNN